MAVRHMISRLVLRNVAKLVAAFAIALSAILAPAYAAAPSAQPPIQCSAQSLLPRFKASDPERYRNFLKEAGSIRNGKHIVWKVEREGLQPSWLFGTIHSSDPRVFLLPPHEFEAFDKVDTVLVELKEVLQPSVIKLELLKHPELTMLMDSKLDQLLPAAETDELSASLRKRGLPMDLVARMRPWFLTFGLQSSSCETSQLKAGRMVLDQAVARKAVDKKIELVGLETPLEQFQALAHVSDAAMLEYLRKSLLSPYSTDDQFETMIDLYKTKDVGKMYAIDELLIADTAAIEQFTQYVIKDRNAVMAERAKPYLDKGRAMIAVGAAHLPGDQGLVELLRKQGFKVTPAD